MACLIRAFLVVSDSLIDKLISELIVNNMSEFSPNGHLRPILRACVASLIVYDRDVVRDFNKRNRDGTQFIHAKHVSHLFKLQFMIPVQRANFRKVQAMMQRRSPH